MKILKVKVQCQGYLVNEIMSVPKVEGNRYYELVKEWLAEGNTPEPEFTEEELLIQFQIQFRFDRDYLLKKTDIAINKAEDLGEDTKSLRLYRQALRDATINWIMPESIL